MIYKEEKFISHSSETGKSMIKALLGLTLGRGPDLFQDKNLDAAPPEGRDVVPYREEELEQKSHSKKPCSININPL